MVGGCAAIDYVVDAIDSVKAKAALIAYCREHAIPMITIGGAGGQIDPTKIEVRDLCRTEQEPLLEKVRKLLRARIWFLARRQAQIRDRRRVFDGAACAIPRTETPAKIDVPAA